MVRIDPKNTLVRPHQRPKAPPEIKVSDIPTTPTRKKNLTCTENNIDKNNKVDSRDNLSNLSRNSLSDSSESSNSSDDDFFTLKNAQYRNQKKNFDSDQESDSSNDSLSDEDDIIPKGIDQTIKKNKQNKYDPYKEKNKFNSRNHCSGGILLVDQNPVNNPYNYNIQAPPQNTSRDDDLEDLCDIIRKMNPEQFNYTFSIIEKMNTCQVNENNEKTLEAMGTVSNPTMVISENETSVNKDELDEVDSAYDTCSPQSSISSPLMNTCYNSEGSPSHDGPMFYGNILPDLKFNNISHQPFKVPSPTPVQLNDTTQSLNNIPVKKPSYRLPSSHQNTQVISTNFITPNIPPHSTHQVLPNLAPESTEVVREEEMETSAEKRIKNKITKYNLEIQWTKVLLDKEFYVVRPNEETILMKHLRSQENPKIFYEILFAYLERIKQENAKGLEFLKYTNRKGESALSIALYECTDRPIITRYILEAVLHLGDDVDQADYNGNTLIHHLVQRGDKFAHIMAELLNMKCFDVNKKNHLLQTPLHMATQLHNRSPRNPNFSTLVISKLLIKHKASILIEDSNGSTPIHTVVKHSCDPQLLKALLSHFDISKSVDVKDHLGNTALHEAASRLDLPFTIQAKVMKQLRDSSWNLTIKNMMEKTPLSLLPEDRLQCFLECINKK